MRGIDFPEQIIGDRQSRCNAHKDEFGTHPQDGEAGRFIVRRFVAATGRKSVHSRVQNGRRCSFPFISLLEGVLILDAEQIQDRGSAHRRYKCHDDKHRKQRW